MNISIKTELVFTPEYHLQDYLKTNSSRRRSSLNGTQRRVQRLPPGQIIKIQNSYMNAIRDQNGAERLKKMGELENHIKTIQYPPT